MDILEPAFKTVQLSATILVANNSQSLYPNSPDWLSTGLLIVWLAGCTILLIRFCKMHQIKQKVLKNSRPVTDKDLLSILEAWRRIHHVRRNIDLVYSAQKLPPFTGGVIRPVICLPQDIVSSYNHDTCNACIGHEVVHIKRFDYLWLQIQWILKIVYFFHPVVWYSCSKIDKYREQICDYETIRSNKISKEGYTNGLLTILGRHINSNQKTFLQPSFGLQYKVVQERIKHIKELNIMRKKPYLYALLTALLTAVFILPMASFSKSLTTTGKEISTVLEKAHSPTKSGHITSRYGLAAMPAGKNKGIERFHRGIDIAAKNGTPVYAIQDGIIEIAINDYKNDQYKAYGKYIKVNHDARVQSHYLHLDKILVEPGQEVTIGQQIGTIGNTGLSTGPHLHMELYIEGNAVDPEQYIKFEL